MIPLFLHMLYTVFYDIPTSCNSCDSGIRMHQRASSEVRNSWQASGQRHWWKTTQLSRCCWVRKTNLRSTEQSREISREAGGIRRSSVSRIIHKDLRLKCCKKRRAQQLTEAHSMCTLFSVCSSRDDNVIDNKLTYMKTAFWSLWIFLPNIVKIDPYNFELYRFKIGPFLRHSVYRRCVDDIKWMWFVSELKLCKSSS